MTLGTSRPSAHSVSEVPRLLAMFAQLHTRLFDTRYTCLLFGNSLRYVLSQDARNYIPPLLKPPGKRGRSLHMQFSSLTLNWARPRESATAQSLSLSHSFTHIYTHTHINLNGMHSHGVFSKRRCWKGSCVGKGWYNLTHPFSSLFLFSYFFFVTWFPPLSGTCLELLGFGGLLIFDLASIHIPCYGSF